jgi:metal-sulfur cluster biosynthetic enzyme
MTFTTQGCPMNELLPSAVKSLLEELPGIAEATIDITWNPPWDYSRMSPVAREKFGLSEDL